MRAARQRRSENTANRVCVYIGVGVYVERRARERDGEMARAPGHVPGSPWQPVRERELSLSGSALVREAALFFLLYLYAPRERVSLAFSSLSYTTTTAQFFPALSTPFFSFVSRGED